MKTLRFSNLICAIWCKLFGNIPKRRKGHDLDDSPFSDNLNRTVFGYRYGLTLEWNTDPTILTSQSVFCHSIFSDHFCLFVHLLPQVFSLCFLSPLFLCPLQFFDSSKGVFTPSTHLSLFFSSLFSFSSLLFLSFLFSSFSLSLPANFWCGDRCHAAPFPTGLIL